MQSSLEPVQTLRCHDPLEAGAIGVAGLHSLARPRLTKPLSKRKSSDFLLEAPHWQRLKGTRKSNSASGLRECPRPESVLRFAILDHGKQKAFDFSPDAQWARRGTKRCRLGSDVEGPNTATVGRKKRRLRTQLITSRLSQPFSQPATHILNRQGRQVGDRRFVKMAVTLDCSRRAAHLQATAYLRYSIMNRLRKRLGIARCQDSGKAGEDGTVRQSVDTFARAPWQPQAAKSSPPEAKAAGFPQAGNGANLHPGSRASREDPGAQPAEALAKAPACRLSKPIALPLPSADADAANDRTSTRIDSTTSPEPRPPLAWMYDDCEEDSFAFLHLDEEHLDDDDSDVYCDFDAIFGVKAVSPDPQSPSEEHTYEEYMDELDGISWRVG
ncbi:hypothetical protein Trco_008434 [Trichoderma cornu-damae]|uniref:Uncharacterized protein n=1 Tax=Trichoderma cornu-damae TaxID=654480 RepID=A0A9P8QFL3_9HYPO|nr:hypothetical protein Trco_008434 [Trichoderma cornu-damae]